MLFFGGEKRQPEIRLHSQANLLPRFSCFFLCDPVQDRFRVNRMLIEATSLTHTNLGPLPCEHTRFFKQCFFFSQCSFHEQQNALQSYKSFFVTGKWSLNLIYPMTLVIVWLYLWHVSNVWSQIFLSHLISPLRDVKSVWSLYNFDNTPKVSV